jgi:hypothetical protein
MCEYTLFDTAAEKCNWMCNVPYSDKRPIAEFCMTLLWLSVCVENWQHGDARNFKITFAKFQVWKVDTIGNCV